MKLSLSLIDPKPSQPRKLRSGLKELATSIRQKGLLEPITVRSRGERYEIICGERRWRAAKRAGLKEIECVVREASDDEAFELALVENLQRENLTPMEEAQAFATLASRGMKQKDIGKLIGKGQSYVAHKVRLAKLPCFLTFFLEHGLVTENHIRQILRLKNIVTKEKGLDFDGIYIKTAVEHAKQKGTYPSKDDRAYLASSTDPEIERAAWEYVLKHIEDDAPMKAWEHAAHQLLMGVAELQWTVDDLTTIIDKIEIDSLLDALGDSIRGNQVAHLRLLAAIAGHGGAKLPEAITRAKTDVAALPREAA